MIASCVRGSTISAHGRPLVLFEAKAAEAAEAAAAAEAEEAAAAAAEVTNKVPEAEAAEATTEVAEPQIEAMEVRNGEMWAKNWCGGGRKGRLKDEPFFFKKHFLKVGSTKKQHANCCSH